MSKRKRPDQSGVKGDVSHKGFTHFSAETVATRSSKAK
jgi:hypothetical protein